MRTYKGYFKPKNPSKYKGDPTNIVYRSSWELRVLAWLDKHPDVISYSSEEVIVPYLSPVDNKWHRYYPDVVVTIKKNGILETLMIEIKPGVQTRPPVQTTGKKKKTFLLEVRTWAINSAKWKAAENFCELRGWKFLKFTEKEIGIING